jgi:hypothetical protein
VKSRTKVTADDAQVMTMTGCLRHDGGHYTLVGTMIAGDELKTKTKTKTDVDKDDTTVNSKTVTKGNHGGMVSSYMLVPRDNLDLAAHVGHQVEISAVMVDAGHGDADLKIKDKTTVDPENARDTTTRSKTKVEVPRSRAGAYTVMSVRPLAATCEAR